jgi:hypothetical protein
LHYEENYLKKNSSATYSRLVQKEIMKKEKLLKELDEKIDETKRDFDTMPVVELIGIAVISNTSISSENIKEQLERPGFIPVYSELSRLNQQINSENSETTHARLQRNPDEWHRYHDPLQKQRKLWKVDPRRDNKKVKKIFR